MSTATSQQNSVPSSPKPNQEIDSATIITDAVPVSMVSPTSIKKKRKTRSKKKSTDVAKEVLLCILCISCVLNFSSLQNKRNHN
jgi:hypothetical protein